MPAAILSDLGHLLSIAARGWRGKDEMHDTAATLRHAGLPGDKDRTGISLDEVFAHLRISPDGNRRRLLASGAAPAGSRLAGMG
ncbi:hypothetical protein ACX9I7_29455 [Streptomyces sp. L500]